jgi:hypothetical protein
LPRLAPLSDSADAAYPGKSRHHRRRGVSLTYGFCSVNRGSQHACEQRRRKTNENEPMSGAPALDQIA